jgi:hypothetical protein
MNDETQALIEKSNQLHAVLTEQKKAQSAYWDRYHGAAKKMHEANAALSRGEINVEQWNFFYLECEAVGKLESPRSPDTSAWIVAREDAMEAVAQEAGLRIRLDGI